MKLQNMAILGSTGSIGKSTLAVIRENPNLFKAYALAGHKNVLEMLKQCIEFKPNFVAMADEASAKSLKNELKSYNLTNISVLCGDDAICDLASLNDVDQVMASIVGTAGLKSTMSAIKKGKRILLANKESLVTSGHIFMQAVKDYQAQLLPVDSEHNAIFQCLPAHIQNNFNDFELKKSGISSILLTGSGGPFRDFPLEKLVNVSPSEAIKHPNWSMGKKISVDSATMMNKGLEFIEAKWLFNAHDNQIELLIHPQSTIHSMVRYQDGSVIAQLGLPDMRTPIAYSMSFPNRINAGVNALDFTALEQLTFIKPDFKRYPCLKLAIEASKTSQSATTALNAANEVAVDAFLSGQIKFLDIASLIDAVLNQNQHKEPKTIDEVLLIDRWAREQSHLFLKSF